MNKKDIKMCLKAALEHLNKVVPCKCEDSAYYLMLAKNRIEDILDDFK